MRRTPHASDLLLGGAFWALLALPSATRAADPVRSLLAVTPTSPWTLRELERAGASFASYDPETGIAWIVATPQEAARLADLGFHLATESPDLEADYRRLASVPDLGLYHTYEETASELASLAAAHPEVCRLESVGKSLEGRDIWALKISDDPSQEDATEPDVLVVGCHHAREFMSVEVPLHLCRTLLEGYGTSPQLTRLVDTRELWVVPLLNADGHVFQEEFQASPDWAPPGWRKNRRDNFDGSFGVDLNRNYGYLWGNDDEGSSPDPMSETYRGSGPFSEPESRALRDLVVRQRFTIALSYHSFGRLLLYPWGYTRGQLTDDHAVFAALADSMVRGNGYRAGNAALGTIYLTNGDLDDWLYGEISPRKPQPTFGFTPELNGAHEGGFWPPESRIAPTCADLLPTNLYALEAADNVRSPLAPPVPRLSGTQDPQDGRRIRLAWTQPTDPGNPVDHWEVFEIDPGAATAVRLSSELRGTSRASLGRVLRPRGGRLVLHVWAELEPLWDYAYVEARGADGAWVALPGDATRDDSPTGRNQGRGITGRTQGRRLAFRLEEVPGDAVDLALRLDAHPQSPATPSIRAALDPVGTYAEERRVLDPDVREPRYDVLATGSGLRAYGVTAVDVHGQRSDSELLFFVIPTVEVSVSDVSLRREGDRLHLAWRQGSDGPAGYEAWERDLEPGTEPGDVVAEWSRPDYRLVASTSVVSRGPVALEWPAIRPHVAVLLRSQDEDGTRIWGPFVARGGSRIRLRSASPNPFRPSTTLEVELATPQSVRLEIVSVDGRVVRLLADRTLDAGLHAFRWDGRDAAGRPAAAGIYLARLRAGAVLDSRRLVLLR